MSLIAALTPPEHQVFHTDEIVDPVRFDVPADLVGITAPTPSAFHAYKLAGIPVDSAFRMSNVECPMSRSARHGTFDI